MEVKVVQNGERIIRASGEIDLGNVHALRTALEEAARESPHGFVIDLSDVYYMDSAGVQALLVAYRSMLDTGGKLALVITHPNVKIILEVTGVDKLPGFLIFDNADSAATAVHHA